MVTSLAPENGNGQMGGAELSGSGNAIKRRLSGFLFCASAFGNFHTHASGAIARVSPFRANIYHCLASQKENPLPKKITKRKPKFGNTKN